MIGALPLDAIGHVPHWPAERNEVTLHQMIVRVIADSQRHAGHADIVRELIDGTAGLDPGQRQPARLRLLMAGPLEPGRGRGQGRRGGPQLKRLTPDSGKAGLS